MPPVRRRDGFDLDEQLFPPPKRWWQCTGYNGLSRLSNKNITMLSLPLKQPQALGKAFLPINHKYPRKLEPSKCPDPSPRMKCHEHAYALAFIWSVTSCSLSMLVCPGFNGRKASDWLRLCRTRIGLYPI